MSEFDEAEREARRTHAPQPDEEPATTGLEEHGSAVYEDDESEENEQEEHETKSPRQLLVGIAACVGIAALIAAVVLGVLNLFGVNVHDNGSSASPTQTSTSAAPTTVSDPAPEVVQPVVSEQDIKSCGDIRTWKSYDDCVKRVAPWMPAEFDKSKDVSKLSWADVENWAARFPNADARVIFVYNWSDITDDQAREEAVKDDTSLDPTAAKALPIVRVDRDFPGWNVVNTRHLEDKRMDPFTDQRPHQVRVSLAPLNDKGEVDRPMAGSGVFVTCFNKHWLEKPQAPSSATTPATQTTSVCDTCCNGPCVVTTTTQPPCINITCTPTTTPPTTTTETTTSTTETTTTSTSPPCIPPEGNQVCMPPKTPTTNPSKPPGIVPITLDPRDTLDQTRPTLAPGTTRQTTPIPTEAPIVTTPRSTPAPTVPVELPPVTTTIVAPITDPGEAP